MAWYSDLERGGSGMREKQCFGFARQRTSDLQLLKPRSVTDIWRALVAARRTKNWRHIGLRRRPKEKVRVVSTGWPSCTIRAGALSVTSKPLSFSHCSLPKAPTKISLLRGRNL